MNKIEILFENRDFIACVKPFGIPSQSDTSGDEDMTVLLSTHLREKGENDAIFVVHRLDRAVGGVMVYAKNAKTAAALSSIVGDKDLFCKEYLAVVCGEMSEKSGNMTDYIFKDGAKKKAFVVKGERKGAKLAILDYEVKDCVEIGEKKFSLLRIRLHTGRFHQIRVQLASHGAPIFGDGKYGSREKAPNIALYSHKLAFSYKNKNYSFKHSPDFTNAPWNAFVGGNYE